MKRLTQNRLMASPVKTLMAPPAQMMMARPVQINTGIGRMKWTPALVRCLAAMLLAAAPLAASSALAVSNAPAPKQKPGSDIAAKAPAPMMKPARAGIEKKLNSTEKLENVAAATPDTTAAQKPKLETTAATPKDAPKKLRKPTGKKSARPTRKPKSAPAGALEKLSDLSAFITVATHAREGRFASAFDGLTPAMGPVAKDVIDWMYFRDGGGTNAPQRIDAFLKSRKGWPNASRLRRTIERGILAGHGGRDFARSYFKANKPVSGDGIIARGALALEAGDKKSAAKWLAQAWRDTDLNKSTEARILKLCRACISTKDDKTRLDAMIYKGRYKTAMRAAARLGKSYVALANARIFALRGLRKSGAAIKKLPASLKSDVGLRHSQIRYLRRKDEHATARKLLLNAPTDHKTLVAPGSWWTERRLLSRHALGAGKPKEAYRLAKGHGYQSGSNFAQGEYLAGWIALRHLDDPKTALTHFERLRAGVKRALSKSEAEYWLARTKEALGDKPESWKHYEAAATNTFSFYGQKAREKIGGVSLLLDLPSKPKATAEDVANFNNRPMAIAARLLGASGASSFAGRFVSALSYSLKSPGEYQLLAQLAEGLSLPHVAVRVGKVALSRDVPLTGSAYPLDNFPIPRKPLVEPALLGGLARQESEFNWRASSHAGARGLMQIMPGTAKDISRNHNLPLSLPGLVADPAYNVAMGEAYLGELIERFDGSYVLAVAGYNAGPGRVGEWIEHYGDPRTSAITPLDWIETIPFNETRGYVKRVLSNLQIYRARIAGRPQPIELAADLERGSALRKRASLR